MNKTILGQRLMNIQELKNSDLNKNGKVDPEESLAVMNYIVKLITAEELANF